MAKMNCEEIARVLNALIGDIEPVDAEHQARASGV